MQAIEIIEKKRDNKILTKEEIEFFLNGYLKEEIPDYQMSAFLMAVYFNGLNDEELMIFTKTMINSGETIEIPNCRNFLVDKHSSGGVGDKTTIALIGLFGCFGIGEIKLSGRGLGHTGGTVDKLESIPNFKFPQDKKGLIDMVNSIGTGIMGYSDKVVPLDKKIYALRDVTGTVGSIPLIASSIMSKKLAIKSNAIILDVKVGAGAFMKTIEEAKKLSLCMINIGKKFGVKVVAILTDMEQPLGQAVGNANEVVEALQTLKNDGPSDFAELVKTIVAVGLVLAGKAENLDNGKLKVIDMLKTNKPIYHFKKFLQYIGCDSNLVENYDILNIAKNEKEIIANKDGFVEKIDAESIGKASMVLGAGRSKKEDNIDHSVGIIIYKKVGDFVKKGEKLAVLQYNRDENLLDAANMTAKAFVISKNKIEKRKIILEILGL